MDGLSVCRVSLYMKNTRMLCSLQLKLLDQK